jgi:hypothetical protein
MSSPRFGANYTVSIDDNRFTIQIYDTQTGTTESNISHDNLVPLKIFEQRHRKHQDLYFSNVRADLTTGTVTGELKQPLNKHKAKEFVTDQYNIVVEDAKRAISANEQHFGEDFNHVPGLVIDLSEIPKRLSHKKELAGR